MAWTPHLLGPRRAGDPHGPYLASTTGRPVLAFSPGRDD